MNAGRAVRGADWARVGTHATQLLVSWVGLSILPAHPIPCTHPVGAGRTGEGQAFTCVPLAAPPWSCQPCC